MKAQFCAMLLIFAIMASCTDDSKDISKPVDVTGAKDRSNHGHPNARVGKTITWKGYTWQVRETSILEGPGPNYFSSSNVWIDANGFLHIKLSKNTATGGWECAELNTTQNLGYGTYQWKIEGALDVLDKNIVFGLFNYSNNDGFDEMDIEFSKWGYADNSNMLNYTVWPATGSSQQHVEVVYPFSQSGGTYTTHRFKRTSNSINFKSLYGFYDNDTNLFANKSWTNPPASISKLAMPIYMNLWLFKGVPPVNGQNVEIIVHDFKFTPL
jgi:hypothetical protein